MCRRYALGIRHYDIQQMHGYNMQIREWVNAGQYQPRYNVIPRSQAPVIRNSREGPNNTVESSKAGTSSEQEGLVLHTMKWGLVPSWAKDKDRAMDTIDVHAEKLIGGAGMWKSLRSWKRCAIPCEGYYYEKLVKGEACLPQFTKRKDGKLLLLAGLYDRVVFKGETEPVFTFTIVTTKASKELRQHYDRQPVILSTVESMNLWLDTTNSRWDSQIMGLLRPHRDHEAPLFCYHVSQEVLKGGADSPTFIEPISERKDGIKAMFSRQTQKATDSPSSSQQSSQQKLAPGTPSKRKRSSSPLPSSSQLKLAPKTTTKRKRTPSPTPSSSQSKRPTKRRRGPSHPPSPSPLRVQSPAKDKAEGKAKGKTKDEAKDKAEGKAKGKAEGNAKGKAKDKTRDEAEGKAKDKVEGNAKDEAKGKAKGRAKGKAKGKDPATADSVNSAQHVIDLSSPADDPTDSNLGNTGEDDENETVNAPTASSSKQDEEDSNKPPPAKKAKASSGSRKPIALPKKTKKKPAKDSEPKITSFFSRSKA